MIDNIQGDKYSEQCRSAVSKLCHSINHVDKLLVVEKRNHNDRSNSLKGIIALKEKGS